MLQSPGKAQGRGARRTGACGPEPPPRGTPGRLPAGALPRFWGQLGLGYPAAGPVGPARPFCLCAFSLGAAEPRKQSHTTTMSYYSLITVFLLQHKLGLFGDLQLRGFASCRLNSLLGNLVACTLCLYVCFAYSVTGPTGAHFGERFVLRCQLQVPRPRSLQGGRNGGLKELCSVSAGAPPLYRRPQACTSSKHQQRQLQCAYGVRMERRARAAAGGPDTPLGRPGGHAGNIVDPRGGGGRAAAARRMRRNLIAPRMQRKPPAPFPHPGLYAGA